MARLALGVDIPDDQIARAIHTGWERVPELLDEAGVGYVVLGRDRGVRATASVSPLLTATAFARRTQRLGLVAAASPQRDHPYNLARRTASVDHISHGRAGWLPLRTDRTIDFGAPDHGTWVTSGTPSGAPLLADAVSAVRALWRTWPAESLALNAPHYRPPTAEVRYADYSGHFTSSGPLNVPTTPQGEPLVFWDYGIGDKEHVAVADIAIVEFADVPTAAAELTATATAHVRIDGRDPDLLQRVKEVAADSMATGVLVRLDVADLSDFLDIVLPSLVSADLVRTASTEPTLRDYLAVPQRSWPDPHRLRPVFASR